MLRIRYMPSDFHPLLLILGERSDLREIADILERFAREGEDVDLDTFAVAQSTKVRVTAVSDRFGLWSASVQNIADRFDWRLDSDSALEFCHIIRDLCADDRSAGSEVLECHIMDEIPVKVSHGEFTDDFLMPDSRIPT